MTDKETDTKTRDEVAELRRELNELKERLAPAPNSAAAAAAYRDEMHALAERRASRLNAWSRDEFAAMQAACPDDVARDIAVRGTVQPPSGAGASGTIKISAGAGLPGANKSGWQAPTPLSNPPGTNYVDRLMDRQDAVDRHDRVAEEAQRQALLKVAEKPKSERPSDE